MEKRKLNVVFSVNQHVKNNSGLIYSKRPSGVICINEPGDSPRKVIKDSFTSLREMIVEGYREVLKTHRAGKGIRSLKGFKFYILALVIHEGGEGETKGFHKSFSIDPLNLKEFKVLRG